MLNATAPSKNFEPTAAHPAGVMSAASGAVGRAAGAVAWMRFCGGAGGVAEAGEQEDAPWTGTISITCRRSFRS